MQNAKYGMLNLWVVFKTAIDRTSRKNKYARSLKSYYDAVTAHIWPENVILLFQKNGKQQIFESAT